MSIEQQYQNEIDELRQENERLRSSNAELLKAAKKVHFNFSHTYECCMSGDGRSLPERARVCICGLNEMGSVIRRAEQHAAKLWNDAFLKALHKPLPLEEWHEDLGPVLWWKFPIEEPPYVGDPLCSDWPGGYTHWTPLPDAKKIQENYGTNPGYRPGTLSRVRGVQHEGKRRGP